LKEHAIADQSVNKIESSSVSIFGEKYVVVGPLHLDHGKEECGVPDDVIDNDT
jgi:hypothetical protein